MPAQPDQPISYSCPYCEGRNIETTATTPYVRGFLLAYQVGSKSHIGCTPCVRKKVLSEAGVSSLIGWFSVTALILNPFLIVYNLAQAPFVRTNFGKARKKLEAAGIPDDQSMVDVTQLGYSLAVSMIAADGEIEESEVQVAAAIGPTIFPDFDPEALVATLERAKDLPSPQDIATLLREVVTEEGKKAVCSYLLQIARADGSFDKSEQALLLEVAENIGIELSSLSTSEAAAGP